MKRIIDLSIRILLSFTFLFCINSCNIEKVQDEKLVEEEVINPNLDPINVLVELPEDVPFNVDQLTVSSAFSEDKPLTNGEGFIQTFKNSTSELIFASNPEGNIVLLANTSTKNTSFEVKLSIESTAMTLIMMHPWTFDLSDIAKAEAQSFIKNLPEFIEFTEAIKGSILTGEFSPLQSEEVLNALIKVQNLVAKTIEKYKQPLFFKIEPQKATITNKESSAAYSVGLYDGNNEYFGHKLAVGIEKLYYFFPDFQNFAIGSTSNENSTVNFNIPSEGRWVLKAKSGLSFDGSLENQQAAYHNSLLVLQNILSMFSGKLKELLSQAANCTVSSGEWLYKYVFGTLTFENSIKKYSKGEITEYELLKVTVKLMQQGYEKLLKTIKSCFPSSDETVKEMLDGYFVKLLKLFDATYKLITAFNTGAMLADWKQFKSEIELCFIKQDGEIIACEGLQFEGPIDFGEVLVGQVATKEITITNIDEFEVEVLEFNLPERCYIELEDKVFQVGESKNATVTFEPLNAQDYSGNIRAIGFQGQTLAITTVSAIGVEGFELQGDLNFGEVPINESKTKSFTIKNTLSSAMSATISFPLGFGDSVQTGLVIQPNETISVDVVFTPELAQEYSGNIIVDTNFGLQTLGAAGTGVLAGTMQITGNTDFGEVVIGDDNAGNISIINNGQIPINVSSIEFINVLGTFAADGFLSGVINAGESKTVLIKFTPAEVRTYSGFLVVNNDVDQGNNTHPVTGVGIDNGTINLSGNMNFGDVVINGSKSQDLLITNNSQTAMTVSSLELPNGFTSDWNSGTIQPNGSQNILVTFSPNNVQQYSGSLVVNNNIDSVNNTIAISGNGISQLALSGDLEFGDIEINTSEGRTLKLINNGNTFINVASIDLPEGFTADWTSGVILANASQDVIITFSPTEVKSYSGDVIVNNDVDNIDNHMSISGNGVILDYVYPLNGLYGPNVLNLDNTNTSAGNFSMHAIIPSGKALKVKVSGSFSYVTGHSTDGDWTRVQSGGGSNLIVEFTSTKDGNVDFHLLINPAGVTIEVYENGDTTPTWTR
ncbi:choice-of-anchor D domain-containing protein [Hyunsoonleella flava]|uniref:Choice-of-anchor D domain-containing protein n=1 Tax=Hyunsoonleella flava TaxID=2527939 RepID=A0A4V2J9W9_9FLAO|nr:choice-of-anchor D domain-containing protein [Hyunsoonleella flava]TBN01305.1 choice-of-anchor D domain-containing protein [Hyunsoonleella flava]